MNPINILIAQENNSRLLEIIHLDASNLPIEWNYLDMKTIVCVYNPIFNLLTNGGKVVGQMELNDGIPTGKIREVYDLNLIRANGYPRQIPVSPYYINNKLFGYVPQVQEKCVAGVSELYLDDNEKIFYSQFIFTEIEPSLDYLKSFF